MGDYPYNKKGPTRIRIERDTLSPEFGRFFIGPFKKGLALALGNSLRRILLSSIEGAAVTSVKISGVYHEFTYIPGIKEDVTDIILQLKGLRLRLQGPGPYFLNLKVEGEGKVLAAHITPNPCVEILNPELPIATLDRGGQLEMEIEVRKGRCFILAERHKKEGRPLGTIMVDSNFSPIIKANFRVEEIVKEGDDPLESLVLEVLTDGSIGSREALAQAAAIFSEHLTIFTIPEAKEEVVPEIDRDEARERLLEVLSKSVEELELSVRAANCLENAKVRYLYELVQKNETELLKMRNFGRKSLKELVDILADMGLSLGMKLPESLLEELAKKLGVSRGEERDL